MNYKKINILLLFSFLAVFGCYLYQTISISSGNVALVALKKEFLEKKNGENVDKGEPGADFTKENLRMTEIEKFDYIIVGRDEFALIEDTKLENKQ